MAITSVKEISEDWFERYLVDHDVNGGNDHHPDLGVGKKPDYRISRGSAGAICEIKEFTTSGMEKRFAGAAGQPMSLSDKEVYGAVRRKISDAASQLKPLADRDDALVVVLANPHGVHVPLWRVDDIVACMYGNQGYSMLVNTETGEGGPGEHVFMRDGALTGKHRYISAVATLHHGTLGEEARQRWLDQNRHRWEGIEERQEKAVTMLEIMSAEFDALAQPEGDYFFVRVYSTLSTVTGEATPVPRALFNGPRDQYWAVNPAMESLELVQGKPN